MYEMFVYVKIPQPLDSLHAHWNVFLCGLANYISKAESSLY